MRVFVSGAAGYIGRAVAETLQIAGHKVVAPARSAASQQALDRMGVDACPGDLRELEKLAAVIAGCDAVIHLALEWGPDAATVDRHAVEIFLEILSGTGRTMIYTSGCWVYGGTKGQVAGDSAPLRPPEIVAWRPAVERLVLGGPARKVNGVVVRPAMVFGRGGGMVAGFLDTARKNGAARVVGNGENRWTFVHVDDLAYLYVRAMENAAGGEAYLAADGPGIKVKEIAAAASKTAGAEGRVEFWPLEEARKELGPLADALVMDQQLSSTKAGRHLGWRAQQPSILEELAYGSYARL